MPRGNGKQAQAAAKSDNGLMAYVKGVSNGESAVALEYVDWTEIDPRLVSGVVWACVKLGGAVMFGSSRDKTCYSVRIYAGSEGKSYYFPCTPNGAMDLEGFLQGLIAIADSQS